MIIIIIASIITMIVGGVVLSVLTYVSQEGIHEQQRKKGKEIS
jgi:flagellar basal body-associated protein FliL